MRCLTRAIVVLFLWTLMAGPRAAQAEDRAAPVPSVKSTATAQAASGDSERKRKAGLQKIIIGSVVAGVGLGLGVYATVKGVDDVLANRRTSSVSPGVYAASYACEGVGALLIVVGVRQRINADQQGIVIPFGGERSELVLKPSRWPSVGYRFAW